jgi:hypothetical protein
MRSKVAWVCREPLVHFLAIGAGFFLLWHVYGGQVAAQPERILITPGHIERIAQVWAKTHLRPPTAEELAGLVQQEIDEEILYREAVALGLDREDLVIRRRLAVKMGFLIDDLTALANPTDEQLQTYLRQHPDKFNLESVTTFAQVYVNPSKHPAGVTAEAERLLALLNTKAAANWQTLGDPPELMPKECKAAETSEVVRHFGKNFAEQLATLPVGRWSGPVKSTYGLHLVLVRERVAAQTPPLKDVRNGVVTAWREEQRQDLNAKFRQQLRAKYAVTVQWPDWAREAAALMPGSAKGSK